VGDRSIGSLDVTLSETCLYMQWYIVSNNTLIATLPPKLLSCKKSGQNIEEAS
jgi:hypothetical protein